MKNTKTQVVARARIRTPAHVEKLARDTFSANKKMNAEQAAYNGLRKQLLAEMDKARIESFRVNGVNDQEQPITLDVKITIPILEVISVEKLRKLVDDKTFMKIVSATKKDVTTHAGTVAVTNSTVNKDGTRNVYVKPAE